MTTTLPRGHRLHVGRVAQAGQIYLVTTVTNKREPLFRHAALGQCLVQTLLETDRSAYTLAYVVMPDHLHWMMKLQEGYKLEEVVNRLKSTSARRINRKLNRVGSMWARGFHDRALHRDEDLLECARYIVANPLRAGLVRRVADYPLWGTIWG